jgi:hypothetical protein
MNLHPRVKSGTQTWTHWVRLPVGFCKRVSFRGFSGFYQFFGFHVSGFSVSFEFWVHLQVKNETRTRTWLCAGQVRVQPVGAKMNPNPHPSDLKPTGDLNPELELPSLYAVPRPLLHHVGLGENTMPIPTHPSKTQPITFLISKQDIPYRTRGSTCCHGVSTPMIRSLADSSNHIPWWS